MKNREDIFNKFSDKIIDDGENISKDEIKKKSLTDSKGKIKIPKDFKKEFYQLDKVTLIEKIFNLKIENEVLRRRLDFMESNHLQNEDMEKN